MCVDDNIGIVKNALNFSNTKLTMGFLMTHVWIDTIQLYIIGFTRMISIKEKKLQMQKGLESKIQSRYQMSFWI